MTNKTRGLICALAGVTMLTGFAAPALAQQQGAKNLGTFKSWTAWQGTDANGIMCYVSSAPTKSEPAGANRDPIHFLIIHRKGLNTKNEVQTLVGYPMKADGTPSAAIDGKVYPMVSEGSAAWLASAGDETGFVAALKAGSSLVVKGTSQRGTNTTDSYSLAGVTAAMAEIDKACQ